MRRYLLLILGLVVLLPTLASAVTWTNGYGHISSYTVPTGSGHICPISASGSVTENPSDYAHRLQGRLRYGHQGTGTVLITMYGPGMYAGWQGTWNFNSGTWDMYLSGGAGQDTLAGWAIWKGTPRFYE